MKNLFTFKSLILSVFLLVSVTAKSQVETIAASMSVTSVVDDINEKINAIINQLDDVMTTQSFQVRSHLMLVIDQVDHVVGKNIDKTFGELKKTQQDFFNELNASINKMTDAAAITLNDVDGITDKLVAFAGTIPGSKRAPVVTGVTPSYFLHAENTDVTVEIKGAWLAKGNPYMVLAGKTYLPEGKIDSKLSFKLPLDLLNDQSRINQISAKLVLYKAGFFKKKAVDYQIALFLVPDKMGTYKLEARMNEMKRITSNRSQNFRHGNDHCQGSRAKTWTFNTAGADWNIDVNTVNVSSRHVSTRSQWGGIHNLTNKGFQIKATVTNNGTCCPKIWPSDTRPCVDGRGSVSGTVQWQEFREVPYIGEKAVIAEGDLFWSNDLPFDLTNKLADFTLTITQIDGKQKVFTGTEVSKWLSVEINPVTNLLVIKPKSPEAALGN